jgi:CRP-like cAMP-binding protein
MPNSCFECRHRASCIIQALDDAGLKKFSAGLKRFSVRGRNTAILNQGQPSDGVLILCEGTVKASRLLPDGSEVIVHVKNAFSLLRWSSTYLNTRRFLARSTVSHVVQLGYISSDDFKDYLKAFPALHDQMHVQQAIWLRTLHSLLVCMKLPVRERLISLIGLIVPMIEQESIAVPLSNIELAQFAQTTPETVSRVINQLKIEGHVTRDVSGEISISSLILRKYVADLF